MFNFFCIKLIGGDRNAGIQPYHFFCTIVEKKIWCIGKKTITLLAYETLW